MRKQNQVDYIARSEVYIARAPSKLLGRSSPLRSVQAERGGLLNSFD